MKRLCDILAIVLTAPLWVPVAGVVAVLVWAKLGRPVLFSQERAGFKGRTFKLYKFRSMLPGDAPDAERLTGFGKFLRATSLDELPEFINILKGEMSLVGPRPLPVRYLPRYSEEQLHRHDVLPGLTGWAQVNGRNALSWETKFRYDLEYVEKHSLAMDFRIVLMTLGQVLFPQHIAHEGEATMSEFWGLSLKGGNLT